MQSGSNNSLFRFIATVLALVGTVFVVLNVIDIQHPPARMLLPIPTNAPEPNTHSNSSAIARIEGTVTPNSQSSNSSDASGSSIQRLATATTISTIRSTRTTIPTNKTY